MNSKLSNLINNINKLVQDDFSFSQTLKGICFELADTLDSNVVIVDKDSKIIAEDIIDNNTFIFDLETKNKENFIDTRLNEQFKNIVEIKENINLNSFFIKNISKSEIKEYTATMSPIFVAKKRVATIAFYKKNNEFNNEEVMIINVISLIISLMIKDHEGAKTIEDERKIKNVTSAINTLSYSEREAIIHIFRELKGTEGLLVASKVADKAGITRSVIVNALRKLESAGVIESRSLGMKGTFIKVLNDYFLKELNNGLS